MLFQEIIRKKRDKSALSAEEFNQFCKGVVEDDITEGQMAALCMAIFLNGLSPQERVDLTRAMTNSGTVIDWQKEKLDGPVLDKHSTGGVGDKVSLILAPIIAACGGYVPMISGRGLGHTGGTLDKMDSIPGYISQPELDSLIAVTKNAGCAIVGATHDIAPADRTLYAVRDVTGTVESIDLITASILSKKLAAGLEGLVMDVKWGNGAFMSSLEDAKALAKSLASVANNAGLPCRALMTDMNQPLGRTAGNALEVIEAIGFLTGESQNNRLFEVVISLAAHMLVLGKLAPDEDSARKQAEHALSSGAAAEHFAKMVKDLRGPSDILTNYKTHLETASVTRDIYPDQAGYVAEIATRDIGIAVIELGGGRRKASDTIDHSVGFAELAGIGDQVGPQDRPLARVYAASDQDAEKAAQRIKSVYRLSETMPDLSEAVGETIT